jgi:glycerol-3-phosphate dehydrogenase
LVLFLSAEKADVFFVNYYYFIFDSAATAGTLDECAIDEEAMSAACLEYSTKVEEMEKLLKAQGPAISALASMAANVKAIKLAVPVAPVGTSSPQLLEAMAEARAVTEEKGITSSEAKIAWETVEELASADNSASLGGKMDADECLVDAAMEACAAMEELQRLLDAAK